MAITPIQNVWFPLGGTSASYRGNTMTNGNDETSTRIGVSEDTDNAARQQSEETLLKPL